MSGPREAFIVRRAKDDDMKAVLAMIQELADFENMSSGPELSVQDLVRDAGLDGSREIFHCYVVVPLQTDTSTDKMDPIGYAICFFTYSTWQGKSYFMEDIYIKPEFRNKGIGGMLFEEIARNAKNFGCKRLDFHVLGWNPARRFYKKMGATDLTELEDWHYYRMQEESLNKLTSK